MTTDREYFEARFSTITAQFSEMRLYIDTRIAEVKSELHQTTTQTIKWVAAIASATVALFVTLVAFLMNNAVPRSAPPAQTQSGPAPIVIVIPASAFVQPPKP
jgi:hypothetical protein